VCPGTGPRKDTARMRERKTGLSPGIKFINTIIDIQGIYLDTSLSIIAKMHEISV
jgi:hypothetical protein